MPYTPYAQLTDNQQAQIQAVDQLRTQLTGQVAQALAAASKNQAQFTAVSGILALLAHRH